MTLYKKTIIIVGLIVISLTFIIYIISKTLMLNSFAELERRGALKDVDRAISALNDEVSEINRVTGDWALWDDTYEFMNGENPDYEKSNLQYETFNELKLDLMVFVDPSGKVVYSRFYNYQDKRELPEPKGLERIFVPGSRLIQHKDSDSSVSGVMMLPEGPVMVASRPILRSDKTGLIRGSLVMGRYLDESEVENLSKVTKLSLRTSGFDKIDRGIADKILASEDPRFIHTVNESELVGYGLVRDIDHNPVLVFKVEQPREVYNQGVLIMEYQIFSIIVVSLIFVLVLIVLLNNLVLSRVANMIKRVQVIGREEDFRSRVDITGSDELSALAESVNKMLDTLEVSQERIKESEENYRTIFETTGTSTWILGADGRIILVNSRFEQFFGYSKAVIEGNLGWKDIILKEFWDAVERCYELLRSEPDLKIQRFEARVRLRDGRERSVLGSMANIPGTNRAVCSLVDITERKRVEEELKYLSLHDALTGLYNRTYFEEEMVRLEKARYNPVGIIICDVDGLKLVNDSLGHKAGDSLLLAAAKVITKCFREENMISRIGGDEFAILLPNSSQSMMEEACKQIQEEVTRYNSENPDLPLSISVGFSIKSDSSVSLGEVFKEADNNMYREKLHRSKSARSAIVKTLMKAMEARDFVTEGHAERMQNMVAELAESIGLTASSIADLRLLAQFHDIGKVGISDSILFKPDKLTAEEMEEMRRHPGIGYFIAVSTSDLNPIANWILYHHEWWNGNGYPEGLKGEEIPLECRILAVIDAYDAMTSDRPYRKALPPEEALKELVNNKGIQFDPELIDRFVELIKNNRKE